MRIAIGCDHRGRDLSAAVAAKLTDAGHDVESHLPPEADSADYPDFASQVAASVAQGGTERGVLVCGTGIGMSIAANRYRGVRAVVIRDAATADICRRHNDCNVLCLPGDLPSDSLDAILQAWLETEFEGGRHQRRVDKMDRLG